jgi:hypothetical protein
MFRQSGRKKGALGGSQKGATKLSGSQQLWFPPKARIGKETYKLEEQLEAARLKGMDRYAEKHHFDRTRQIHMIKTVRGSVKGVQKIDGATLSGYHLYIEQIGKFAARISDYRTALICDRKCCPFDPHPVDPLTLALFFRWKSQGETEVLTYPKDNCPVIDKLGRTIHCTDDWKCPSNVSRYDAAVKSLHATYEHLRGPYQEPCTDCVSLNSGKSDGQFKSCRKHANAPLLTLCGDSTRANTYQDQYKQTRGYLLNSHVVKGNLQLQPVQVRTIRSALIAKNDIHAFQMWVMLIIGIRLMLRSDELLGLTVEDFLLDHAQIQPTRLGSVGVEVQGKTDAIKKLLLLWRDDDYPDLCPLRPLLVYLHWTGIKSGPLFPDRDSLNDYMLKKYGAESETSSNKPVKAHGYDAWLLRMKTLFKVLFPSTFGDLATEPATVGTHTLRKTGKLLISHGLLLCFQTDSQKYSF